MSRGAWRRKAARARWTAVVRWVWLAVVALVEDPVAGAQARAEYEVPPTLSARDLVPAERLQGPGYQVDDAVPTDGFLATFTVRSDHGVFTARGPGMLEIRLGEVAAIRQLEAMSKSDVFVQGLTPR